MLGNYTMKHTLELFNVFRDMATRERAETYFEVLKHLEHNIKQVHSDLYFYKGNTYTSEQLLEEISPYHILDMIMDFYLDDDFDFITNRRLQSWKQEQSMS